MAVHADRTLEFTIAVSPPDPRSVAYSSNDDFFHNSPNELDRLSVLDVLARSQLRFSSASGFYNMI